MTAPSLAPSQLAAADWRRLWSFCRDPYLAHRRATREVAIGDVRVGGRNPVRVQSMTVSDTLDTARVVDEIAQLRQAGCEIVRVTAPTRSAAENLGVIRTQLAARGVHVALVADIHFTPQAALIAADHVDKVRINPGNYADRKHFAKWEYTDAEYASELERLEEAFRPLVLRCKERGIAMRIGTNHGSLSDRILNRYGDTPLGMVESALEFVRICEHHGYHDLVLSMKASDVKVMIQAYRLLALRMSEVGMDYPFHLGVTEAGAGFPARVKSAIGIGALLADGLGDTVRVSLAEDSVHELVLAAALVAPRAERTAQPGAAPPASQSGLPLPIDPFRFSRRSVRAVGTSASRLATDTPPRLELLLPAPDAVPVNARAALAGAVAAAAGADLVILVPAAQLGAATWLPALAACFDHAAAATPELGLEIPFAWLAEMPPAILTAARRVALRIDATAFAAAAPPALAALANVQYVLDSTPDAPAVAAALVERIAAGAWSHGALSLAPPVGEVAVPPQAWRQVVAALAGSPLPIVLRARLADAPATIDAELAADELDATVMLGALLADGIGDAVQIDAAPVRGVRLGREILQATRLRLTKADFIACPSCGRTQFDLQSTTARISERLHHLRGLKIAVMGCIVNGPGEMADADYGYVGSGPGRIDLYVGQERVERGVPQAEAVDRLVALIHSRGQWVEPEPLRLDSPSRNDSGSHTSGGS